jgi:hypothetical protein
MMPSSAAALSTLSDFNSKRQSAQDIYSTANTQYDVGGGVQRVSALKGQVGNLQSSLDAVDPSVTGRTTGNFTTEGQRSALVGREQQPILGNLSKTQTNLGNEQGNLSTSQGLASQLASAMINQDQTKYQSLLDQYNAAVASEQAAEQKRQWEAQQAEAKRQFDEQQAAAARAAGASGAGGYSLGGGGTLPAAPAAAKGNTGAQGTQQQAYNALKELLGTKNKSTILNTIAAIQKSASYGNAYDKQKLAYIQNELAGQFQPYLVSNNSSLRF